MSILVQQFPLIKQGSDFVSTLPLQSTTPPSSVSFVCQIRRAPGAVLLATVQTSWDGQTLSFFMPSAVTAKIPATGSLGNPYFNQWVYDLMAIYPDGSRECIMEGPVIVDPSISQT
jgi:hypothetical protein